MSVRTCTIPTAGVRLPHLDRLGVSVGERQQREHARTKHICAEEHAAVVPQVLAQAPLVANLEPIIQLRRQRFNAPQGLAQHGEGVVPPLLFLPVVIVVVVVLFVIPEQRQHHA